MLSALFFRPRPLQAVKIKAVRAAGGNPTTGLSGWGVISAAPSSVSADLVSWGASKWVLLFPGVYRLEIVGPGGGGGGGYPFYARRGWPGEPGAVVIKLVTFKVSTYINVGSAGLGGAEATAGSHYNLAVSRVGMDSAAPGVGGAPATSSSGATEAQRLAAPGTTLSDGTTYGKGGDGGASSGSGAGSNGQHGAVLITLVG